MLPQYGFLNSENFSEGLAQAGTDFRRNGFIDTTGRMTIPATCFMTRKFSEGLAKVWPTPLEYGFINKAGRLVIPAVYQEYGCDFHDGLACVKKDGKYGFVDKSGRMAIPFRFQQAFNFSEGIAPCGTR